MKSSWFNDLGGGRLMFVLDVGEGCFQVRATSGRYLPRRQMILIAYQMDYLIETFKKDNGIDLHNEPPGFTGV